MTTPTVCYSMRTLSTTLRDRLRALAALRTSVGAEYVTMERVVNEALVIGVRELERQVRARLRGAGKAKRTPS